MTDIPSVEEQRTDPDRRTTECPNCNGTVREPRSGDMWICDDCARYWEVDELPEVAA